MEVLFTVMFHSVLLQLSIDLHLNYLNAACLDITLGRQIQNHHVIYLFTILFQEKPQNQTSSGHKTVEIKSACRVVVTALIRTDLRCVLINNL